MKHDGNSDFPRILECEKLMAKNMLCSKVYQVNLDGRTRLSRGRRELMMSPEFLKAWYPLTYGQITLIHTRILLGWFDHDSLDYTGGYLPDQTWRPLSIRYHCRNHNRIYHRNHRCLAHLKNFTIKEKGSLSNFELREFLIRQYQSSTS